MTRALVMQMLEALEVGWSPRFTGKDARALSDAAITAAREYLATEPSGERARRKAAHESHCYQGEYEDTCKYGDTDCPAQRNSEPKPSGERAELIAQLRDAHGRRFDTSPSPYSRAADMLKADAQQANKPTGWDNGLSQDYCAEFGQWLASRPGARQQIKEMFDEPESEDLYTLALKADNWGQP